jgi:hypothetical protein
MMNKPTISALPDENRIEELLKKIQPVPSENFQQKMRQAAWRTGNPESKVKGSSGRRLHFALTTTVVILFAGLLISPQGRAWAQEVVEFFRRINATSIPVSEEEKEWMNAPVEQYDLPLVPVTVPTLTPEMASLPECQVPEDAASYACQVAHAEAQLDMDLKEFPKTPEDWIFKTLRSDRRSRTASLVYNHSSGHGGDFILRQGEGTFQSDYGFWSAVPADKVEPVMVGPYAGEYVLGGFSLAEGDNAWRWDTSFEEQRLAWSDGKRWYYIEILPPSPAHLSREKLVELAAGLVDTPLETADPINPDAMASIAKAEEYSGLDLKAPGLLPLGYDFSYARYFPARKVKEVHLHYKSSDDLIIYEWEGTPDDFDRFAKIYTDHALVEVNGNPAFYGVREAASENESSYLLLAWHAENINYRIYFFYNPARGGGMIDQEKMIAIAESMGDINDYQGNTDRPYEYIAIYEKALGLDAKEFSTTPDGWSFSNVYAYPDCLSIAYSAVNERGELFLSQCKTDDMLFPSKIPEDAIEQVNINGNDGQYVAGNFEYDDNGAMSWKSDAPMRHLRWQEDGLWIQIILSGDSIVRYDKDALISYAESLR